MGKFYLEVVMPAPKFVYLTNPTMSFPDPGQGLSDTYVGLAALLGDSNQIPGRGPSLLLFDGSGTANGSLPNLAAALNQDALTLFNNGLALPIFSADERATLTTAIPGLMVLGDDGTFYNLQGDPTAASFNDGELSYTVRTPGQFGNQYVLFYDETLPDNTYPIIVTLESSFTPLGPYTLHIQISQNFDTTIGDILLGFQNAPTVASIINAVQTSGSPSDQPNFGGGHFTGGSPTWTVLNQGSFLSSAGLNSPTHTIDWGAQDLTNVSELATDILDATTMNLYSNYDKSTTPVVYKIEGGPQDGGIISFKAAVDTANTMPTVLAEIPVETFSQGQDSLSFYVEIRVVVSASGGSVGGTFLVGLHILGNYSSGESHLTIQKQQVLFSSVTDAGIHLAFAADDTTLTATATGLSQAMTWRLTGTCYNSRG